MNIRIYTDLENPDSILMDISSLIHAYEYAVKEGNNTIASLLKPLFTQNTEIVKVEKASPIYTFLKNCPMTMEDEITWDEIKGAFLTARLQNNKAVLQELGKVLGHWEQHVLEQNELDGLVKELVQLPKEIQNYILKYHNTANYENRIREQVQGLSKKPEAKDDITRGVAEIVGISKKQDKIYKKAA